MGGDENVARHKPPPDAENGNWQNVLSELRLPLSVTRNDNLDAGQLEVALRERVKELNCLYGIAQLAERRHDSLDGFLTDLVELLPPSWQYPEIACARALLNDKSYKTAGFRVTKWRQASQIFVYNEHVGQVEVFYMEERPPEDEGPFLKEERVLLDNVADQIGKISMRISAEMELKELNKRLAVERKALQETNAAMKAVLARIEEDKKNIYRDIHSNIEKIVMPILYTMSLDAPDNQRKFIEILKANLENITSPFVSNLSRKFFSLTPTEIKVCNMIRNGMQTKEIARIQGISSATVNRHREHIRKKLGLTNRDVNLSTYLQSSMWEEQGGGMEPMEIPGGIA